MRISRPQAALILSRRQFAGTMASAAALFAFAPQGWAQATASVDEVGRFIALSAKLSAYDDLDPVIAARIHAALLAEDAANGEKLAALATLSDTAPDARALKQAAEGAGLGDLLTAVLLAWYTGTVTGAQTTMIAYHDALMYRPTADGLVIPTYCNKGPLWWRDQLPPGITRAPLNIPEVL